MRPTGIMKLKVDTSLRLYRNVFQSEWQMLLRFCVSNIYLCLKDNFDVKILISPKIE